MSPTAVRWEVRSGRLMVVKTGAGPDEAELLGSLDHPGIVRLIETMPSGELLLEPSGASTLAAADPTPAELAGLARDLIGAVAFLHTAGVTHGALSTDHVIWAPGRRPVICGFGRARRDGEPAIDLAAVRSLLAPATDIDPVLARVMKDGSLDAAGMARLLDTESGSGSHRRPPARPRPRRHGSDTTATAAATLLVATAVIVAAALVVGPGFTGEPPVPSVTPSTVPTVEPGTAHDGADADAPAPGPRLSWAPSISGPVRATCPGAVATEGVAIGSVDIDGDGCAETIERVGSMLIAGRRRFELGAGADHVVVGDWFCGGTPTPALVTGETGAVHLFPHWPDDTAITVDAVAVVGPTISAEVMPVGRCDAVRVVVATGRTLVVRAPADRHPRADVR